MELSRAPSRVSNSCPIEIRDRTEGSYADSGRRFFEHLARQQSRPHPRVDTAAVRNYLTYLAVNRGVSANTQNQAFCAILFLCREVLGIGLDDLGATPRAKRGERLPVVLSVPETLTLLAAMRGLPRLMASLIYGGGLRVSECCELRVKDIDVEQGLLFVRAGSASGPLYAARRQASRREYEHADGVSLQPRP